MTITVIRRGSSIEQLFFGEITPQIEDWIKQLNSIPIETENWSCEEQYTEKYLSHVVEFLDIKY